MLTRSLSWSGASTTAAAGSGPRDRPPSAPDAAGSGAARPPELLVLVGGVTLFNLFGITWGLPNPAGDWAIDSIAPLGPLQYAKQMLYGGHWWSKYPPLQFTLLTIVYAPYAAFLALTDALHVGAVAQYPYGLAAPELSVSLFTLMARMMSAFMSVGVAVAIYRIGVELHGRLAGVLASVIFTCSPLAIYYADAANLEMPYLFWSSFALLSLVRMRRGAERPTWIAFGVFAAAAVATKDQAYGLFLLLPAASLTLASRERRAPLADGRRLLTTTAAAGIATYLLAANVLIDPRGWLDHLWYITHDGSRPYQMYPATLAGYAALTAHVASLTVQTATPPIVALAAVGLGALEPTRRRGAWLLVFAACSYVATFIGPILYVFPRFVLPVVLVTSTLAGVGGAALWQRGGEIRRAAVVGALLTVFAYGTSMNLGLVWDSRYDAEAWLAEHVPAGTVVGVNGEGVYLPRIPLGLRTVSVDVTASGLGFVGEPPAYLVFSDAYYARYLRRPAVRSSFEALLDGEAGYEPVATFFRPYLLATSLIPTMNPRIVVLRRVAPS